MILLYPIIDVLYFLCISREPGSSANGGGDHGGMPDGSLGPPSVEPKQEPDSPGSNDQTKLEPDTPPPHNMFTDIHKNMPPQNPHAPNIPGLMTSQHGMPPLGHHGGHMGHHLGHGLHGSGIPGGMPTPADVSNMLSDYHTL